MNMKYRPSFWFSKRSHWDNTHTIEKFKSEVILDDNKKAEFVLDQIMLVSVVSCKNIVYRIGRDTANIVPL